MNLVTPDFGLLFWMVLIFGIVFLILAKFGFPVITGMVEKRTRHINESLRQAEKAQEKIERLAKDQEELVAKTRQRQSQIMAEAEKARQQILAQAKSDASAQADKILDKAREEIDAAKERALKDIRSEVATLSLAIAEKLVRHELAGDQSQKAYLDSLVDEMDSSGINGGE